MTGPEHYREAERLAGKNGLWCQVDTEAVPRILARAQVHATLAQAAATVAAGAVRMHSESYRSWHAATGEK
jgi:hypothetical protein